VESTSAYLLSPAVRATTKEMMEAKVSCFLSQWKNYRNHVLGTVGPKRKTEAFLHFLAGGQAVRHIFLRVLQAMKSDDNERAAAILNELDRELYDSNKKILALETALRFGRTEPGSN